MKRINKQLLTGLVAMSLITPLATTELSNQIPFNTMSVSAKSRLVKLPYHKLNASHKRAVKFDTMMARGFMKKVRTQKKLARTHRKTRKYHLNKAKAYYKIYRVYTMKENRNRKEYIKIRVRKPRAKKIHYRKYEVDSEDGIAVTNWNRLSNAIKRNKDYRRTKTIPAWTTFYGARMSKFDEPVYHIHYHGHWYWYTEDSANSDGRIGDPGF